MRYKGDRGIVLREEIEKLMDREIGEYSNSGDRGYGGIRKTQRNYKIVLSNRFTMDLELIGRPLTECLGSFLMLAGETIAGILCCCVALLKLCDA